MEFAADSFTPPPFLFFFFAIRYSSSICNGPPCRHVSCWRGACRRDRSLSRGNFPTFQRSQGCFKLHPDIRSTHICRGQWTSYSKWPCTYQSYSFTFFFFFFFFKPLQAIKGLQDKLNETRATAEPRQKFSFKTRKNASAVSLADAAELAVHGRLISGYIPSGTPSTESSSNATPTDPSTPLDESDRQAQQKPEVAPTSCPFGSIGTTLSPTTDEKQERKARGAFPAQRSSSCVSVDNHHRLHIMLPSTTSDAAVPASITSLRHCVVDMSIPTANGKPHTNLTIKNVKDSLLVCGQISGPAHIMDVRNSVIVVSCQQFRMHNCKNVDVYLSSSSNPIIEDCSNIRFGRIPKAYVRVIASVLVRTAG